MVVLTGAGISASSGIPTYRDHGGRWQRSQPIQHNEFIQQPEKRQRYWARSVVGWQAVTSAQASTTHHALAKLEKSGLIPLLVTQNVDRLHQRAGHQQVVDLHGRLDRATCLDCHNYEAREAIQQRLLSSNGVLVEYIASGQKASLAPDGDAHIEDRLTKAIHVPSCLYCGGVLMPDVVFFGGTVPSKRVQKVTDVITSCDALLVVGSSLMVYSGYRFCRQAADLGKKIAIINQGVTRADDLADLKLETDCDYALGGIAAGL